MATTTSAVTQKKKSPVVKRSPFRATKLWNQLLSSFKEGMELKRKRWRLKSYEQCFSGADAMQWLYAYLQNHPSFGAHVTKEQTYMLLQKFLENNVFQGVAVVKNCNKFQDTNYLYRFVDDDDKIKKDKSKEVITTKEDKENFNSRNSLSNLMRTMSKRNSKSDINPSETLSRPNPLKHKTPLKEDGSNLLKANKPAFTPLAKNLDDMSLLVDKHDKNYSKFSTLLFESDDEDVFETSISNHYLTRCNSLQTWKRDTHPSVRRPLETLWINEYNKTESEFVNKLKHEKKNDTKKLPRNFGKASLYNFKKNSRLRKRKSDDVGSNKLCSKLEKLTEVHEDQANCKKRKSGSTSQESLSSGSASSLSLSTVSHAGSQGSISGSLPSKALAILGEDPSHIQEVECYNPYQVNVDINSPIYKKHKFSPTKSASNDDQNKENVLDKENIGSITNICEKGSWGSNNHDLSYCNLLINDATKDLEAVEESNSLLTTDDTTEDMAKFERTIKKARSFSFIGPNCIEKNNYVKTRNPPRRTHAMLRRSISQSSLKRRNFGSQKLVSAVDDEQGYPFNYSADSADKNRLYKVLSSWSIDTIGLPSDGDGARKDIPEITVDDVEETWKNVSILSLKKLLGVDPIKDLFDIAQIHGANIMKNVSWNPSEISQDAPGWLLSAMNCLIDWPNISKDAEDSILQDLPNYPGFERDVYRAVKEHYHTTLSKPLIPEHLYPLVQECADVLHENKDKGIRIMQHIILLLPCWNRRQLQLLLHFMSKVSTNYLLEISNDLPNRDLVIHSFLQLIIREGKHTLTLEAAIKPMRIVNLLIDSYDLVFKAPPSLRGQVDHKLAVLLGTPSTVEETPIEKGMSAETDDSTNRPQFYCKQITKAAYEKEAKDNYHKAINDLLTTYMTDQSFTEKERKKRLKQFQKAYPEIYAERFASHDVSNCSTISEFSTNFRHAAKPSFLREKIL